MNKGNTSKIRLILPLLSALVFTALYFTAIYVANIYGSDFLRADKIKGTYIVFMLISVVLLLAEYIFFGRKDNLKKTVANFIIHNVFGIAGLFVCRVVYSANDMEKQCLFSADDALKHVFFGKWVSYVCITLAAAVVCYLLGSDEKTEKRNGK